jgi:hypothetical protein
VVPRPTGPQDSSSREPVVPRAPAPPPDLGPLAVLVGDWYGYGFNTIFRPDNTATPTPLPIPVTSDNILELNVTSEKLSFSPNLGSVPNRGTVQGDVFLTGVPYTQRIDDITFKDQPVPIHFEPGVWMIVPATTNPAEGVTLVRMASIPHGTTILAQGTSTVTSGAPYIDPVDITPFTAEGKKVKFASQTAEAMGTARIPQDLRPFMAAGTITQDILNDPASVLRAHLAEQTISSTTTISISTSPAAPLFGGGTDNIAFLIGQPKPNARAAQMTATFWFETVEQKLVVPSYAAPGQPLLIKPEATHPSLPVPTFSVTPTRGSTGPQTITVQFTQIQYRQTVVLDFADLSWPHVSIATLVPQGLISVRVP